MLPEVFLVHAGSGAALGSGRREHSEALLGRRGTRPTSSVPVWGLLAPSWPPAGFLLHFGFKCARKEAVID